jgi:hypothetical protein
MIMAKKILRTDKTVGRLTRLTAASFLALILLLLSFLANAGLASSPALAAKNELSALALQDTGTPTATLESADTPTATLENEATPTATVQLRPGPVYTFSLASLGYDQTILSGSTTRKVNYSFRVPDNWTIDADGQLVLDLSYIYSQLDTTSFPTVYGTLTVTLDDQTVEIYTIKRDRLNRSQLTVTLPVNLLNNPDRDQHIIGLEYDDKLQCVIPHDAQLTIHPESIIVLPYQPSPLQLDLSTYPRPFFQRAFEPDQARFILPSTLTSADLSHALPVAAKLGNLTNNRLIISGTRASSLTTTIPMTPAEHLIVIGQPQHNELLPLLNEQAELPVSLHQRELELVSTGPTVVASSSTFTYNFTLNNTSNQAVKLTIISALSHPAKLMTCEPDCKENTTDHTITWSNASVAAEKSLNLSLTLEASDIITSSKFETTITVFENGSAPINADTLTASIAADATASDLQTSTAGAEGYFFMYNGRAVAKEDGIIQEIVSPWDEGRAILIITGLSDEAVKKASQAMSSETRFPGMTGPVALVQEALSPSEIEASDPLTTSFTLADLGYGDEIIRGKSPAELQYVFDVPYGWQLTDEASLDLYFTHAQLANFAGSSLTVLMNKTPIASIALSEATANDGYLQVSLAEAGIHPGQTNRLVIQSSLIVTGEGCGIADSEGAFWLRVKKNSELHLVHTTTTSNEEFNLKNYPNPFDTRQDLADVLVALPAAPADWEWEAALNLGASLGSSVASKTIIPAGLVGDDMAVENLGNYQIMAIGRPSRHSLIQQANPQLPQPFLPASDEIEQRLDDVILRLPSGLSLGYVQLITSPWNKERAFLAITGTTDEGVQRALRAVISQAGVLEGNLTLFNGDKIFTLDTRKLTGGGVAAAVATALPEMTPVPTATAAKVTPTISSTSSVSSTLDAVTAAPSTTSTNRGMPSWVIPVVGINGLIVLGIFAFVFWQTRHRRL